MQGIKEEAGGHLRGQQDMAPGGQVVAGLDLFAGLIIIQEDVGGGSGMTAARAAASGKGVFLADGGAHVAVGDPPDQVPDLRPEVQGQPDYLEAPENEEQPGLTRVAKFLPGA